MFSAPISPSRYLSISLYLSLSPSVYICTAPPIISALNRMLLKAGKELAFGVRHGAARQPPRAGGGRASPTADLLTEIPGRGYISVELSEGTCLDCESTTMVSPQVPHLANSHRNTTAGFRAASDSPLLRLRSSPCKSVPSTIASRSRALNGMLMTTQRGSIDIRICVCIRCAYVC